jgi:hypothetical protein
MKRFMKKTLQGIGLLSFSLFIYVKIKGEEKKTFFKTNYPQLININLEDTKKIIKLSEEMDSKDLPARMKSVISDINWEEDSKVIVTKNIENTTDLQKVNYYVGGLESLFSCVRKLENNTNNEKCIFVNDGKPLIAQRAGMQLHEHPTQYNDYTLIHLFMKSLELIKLYPRQNPEVWNFSPLHLNLPLNDFSIIYSYLGFFYETMKHKFTNVEGSSENDRQLVKMIRESIQNMKNLDMKIQTSLNKSIINRNGRIYWSIDKDLIMEKRRVWKGMDINCEIIPKEEINKITLIDANKHEIHALKMFDDGEVHPDIIETIIEYLHKTYPTTFEYHGNTTLKQVNLNEKEKPISATEENNTTKMINKYSINEFYCSLGHNEVYENNKKKYNVIPVAGISSDWSCTVDKEELTKRGVDLDKIKNNIVPSADMFNLHVKIIDYKVTPDNKIKFYCRVTGGANLFHKAGDKDDLVNIVYKLNEFFVGDWEILTVGSCTRKTAISNRPEGTESDFHFGQSGVGISLSAGNYSKYFEKNQ